MQTSLIKLLKSPDGRLLLFFFKGGAIYAKEYTKDFSSPATIISEGVLPGFSLCVDNGSPIIIARRLTGDVFVFRKSGGLWQEKMLIKSNPLENLRFIVCNDNGKLHTLFNQSYAKSGLENLTAVSFYDRIWHPPITIDAFYPMAGSPYTVVRISDNHVFLFYRAKDIPLVSTEISLSPLKIGTPIPIINGKTTVYDVSSFVEGDTVHISAIIRGRYGCQLIYKNRTPDGMSQNSVIWERQKIDTCIVFRAENKLWIMCSVGSDVFCSYSDDNGGSFCPIYRYRARIKRAFTKAEFIDLSKNNKSIMSEVYVFSEAPNEITIIGEIVPELIPSAGVVKAAEASYQQENVDIYKNKIKFYENELFEANRKLGELTKKLAKRNEEISAINSQWINKFNKLKSSYEASVSPEPVKSPPPEESSP